MPTFIYQAEDERGNLVSGQLETTDEQSARITLKDQKLNPTRVRAQMMLLDDMSANGRIEGGQNFSHREGNVATLAPPTPNPMFTPVGQQSRIDAAPFLVSVPLPDLAIMFRQMSTLLGAGVPMVQALVALSEQTKNARLKEILLECVGAVSAGHALSTVMEKHPAVFSSLQIEMIHAAELSGMMETMCSRIADYLEREIDIRRKLQRETLYPKIVLFVAGCVILLLAFLKSGASGPIGMLIFAGTTAAIGFALWWGVKYANQYPEFGAMWDRLRMMVPGAGGVTRRYATARFTRALAALYGGGVLLSNAVAIAARASGNKAIGQAMLDNVYRLENGEGVAGMLGASGLLSPIAVQMARTGEQTGSLDAMMEKVADYLESEADVKSHQYAVITGVVVLLIAAMVVLYIAVSFYSGQFSAALGADKG